MKMNIKMLVAAVALSLAGVANASFTVEQEAYIKAVINAERATCLKEMVDDKIDGDIEQGKIRDFGNVLSFENLCTSYAFHMKQRAAADKDTLAAFETRAKKYLKEKFNV